jgi:hypothetical protein
MFEGYFEFACEKSKGSDDIEGSMEVQAFRGIPRDPRLLSQGLVLFIGFPDPFSVFLPPNHMSARIVVVSETV